MAWTPASSSATVPEPAGRICAFPASSANSVSNVFTGPMIPRWRPPPTRRPDRGRSGGGDDRQPVVPERPAGVVGDLPRVPVRVGDVGGVAAPLGARRRGQQRGAGRQHLRDALVDLVLRPHVDGQRGTPPVLRRPGTGRTVCR